MEVTPDSADVNPSNTQPLTDSFTSTIINSVPTTGRHSAYDFFENKSSGTFHVLIASHDYNYNVGNFHPMKLGKIFTHHFNDIKYISSVGLRRVKIFD